MRIDNNLSEKEEILYSLESNLYELLVKEDITDILNFDENDCLEASTRHPLANAFFKLEKGLELLEEADQNENLILLQK